MSFIYTYPLLFIFYIAPVIFIYGWLVFSLLLIFKYILFWIYLWQLKEYRLDRMRDFLWSPEGWRIWLSKNYLIKIGLIFLSLILLFLLFIFPSDRIAISFSIFLLSLLIPVLIIAESAWFILKIWQKKIVLPIWTGRSKLTVFLSFLFILSILIIPISQYPNIPISKYILLTLFLIILMPLIVSLMVIIITPFTAAVKYYICRQAKLKRQQFKDLIVIGVTGSYGKTSVKEFTAQILSRRFKVLKTEKNINTEIGIARTILKKLTSEHQIFVCEIGAYKRGEIKKSGKIARPQIAVITGINEQHLSLFGSLENIIAAKSEIILNLTPQLIGGLNSEPSQAIKSLNSNKPLVFLNYDSENIRQIKVPSSCQKITYGITNRDADVRAKFVDGQWFLSLNKEIGKLGNWEIGKLPDCQTGGGNWELEIGNLLGKHNVLNLLPAIAIAWQLGMNMGEIELAIKNIKPPAGTMQVYNIIRGATKFILIDDTYNANPAGVKAALEVLSDYNGVGTQNIASLLKNKILILDDILELGREALRIHQEIGERIAKMNLAKVILIGKNYAGLLRKILLKAGSTSEQAIIYQPGMKIDDIIVGQKAIILFEGRRAKQILDLVLEIEHSRKFSE